jgi:hypothetical protein
VMVAAKLPDASHTAASPEISILARRTAGLYRHPKVAGGQPNERTSVHYLRYHFDDSIIVWYLA